MTTTQTTQSQGAPSSPAAKPRRGASKVKRGQEFVDQLCRAGFDFCLDDRSDALQVNGKPISDAILARLHTQLQDWGYGRGDLLRADDAILAYADGHRFHPVKTYLEGLKYEGNGPIAELAAHIVDAHGVLPLYLRKWLIAAVHRVYTGEHHAVLVLEGPQGLGKSKLVQWLNPLPGMYIESGIDPDVDDHKRRIAEKLIWEVTELGSTTRRADVEALKAFLSMETVTFRPKYGRCDVVKPALASFIGTVNKAGGALNDPTGSRRFWATTLTALDWRGYTARIDRDQVWAEAFAAYRMGESWQLDDAATQAASAINAAYEVEDPIENILTSEYTIDPAQASGNNPTWWVSSAAIMAALLRNGVRNASKITASDMAAALVKLGCVARKQRVRGKEMRGWQGLQL